MAASDSVSDSQFPDYLPYPRLRENYARNWSEDISFILNEDPSEQGKVRAREDARSVLESGRHQAKMMMTNYLYSKEHGLPTESDKDLFIELGFRQRHNARRLYGSWYN